jgi:hypothetical protein
MLSIKKSTPQIMLQRRHRTSPVFDARNCRMPRHTLLPAPREGGRQLWPYRRYPMTNELTSLLPVTSCIVDSAATYILWWSNLEILFGPLHRSSPFIGELRCQASNSSGTRSVYSRENPKRSI